MTRVEILRKAREHIKNGWIQRCMDDGVSCCAMGAIERATGGPPLWPYTTRPEVRDLERYLANLVGADDNYNVFVFNDRPWRTKEEVLALFDRAIAGCGS